MNISGQPQLATPVPSQFMPVIPGLSSSQDQSINIGGQSQLAIPLAVLFLPATPGPLSCRHQSANISASGLSQLATPVPSQSLPATPGLPSSQHQPIYISGQSHLATSRSSSIQRQRLNPLTNLVSCLPNRQSLLAPDSLPDITGEVLQC